MRTPPLKTTDQTRKSAEWIYPCLASGLLLGLSVPSFSFLPLGFLAWAWMAPLLFELKRTDEFFPFFKRVLVAVGAGFSLITLWVVNASLWGFLASALMGTLVWTTPLAAFYVARRFLNWKRALFSLPFVWTAWEWLYHGSEFSFGAVRQGYLQADLLWLIQFADITGVEGVTFWLITVNISIFLLIEKLLETRAISSETSFRHARRAAPRAILCLALFAAPLVYSAVVFWQPQGSEEKEITILAVQPNVSPFVDYSPKQMVEIYGRQFALTERAVKENTPDLIVWHEAAVPFVLSEDAAANGYFAKQIAKWNAPVLTGLIEVRDYADNEPRPPLLEAQNRTREFFNAAALFQRSDVREGRLSVDLSQTYQKRRLMPFLEQVPFSQRFPMLANLIIPIGVRPRLTIGSSAKTFDFKTKAGETARVGTMICYENLYPEMSADMIRNGAQFLAAITNEGFFAGSQGQYQLAAFSRFRAIETRRAMVRTAATGKTWATDKFGRTTAQAPMWSEQTLYSRVRLSDERTLYVRWGNFFPKACALIALLFTLTAITRIFKSRILNRSGDRTDNF